MRDEDKKTVTNWPQAFISVSCVLGIVIITCTALVAC